LGKYSSFQITQNNLANRRKTLTRSDSSPELAGRSAADPWNAVSEFCDLWHYLCGRGLLENGTSEQSPLCLFFHALDNQLFGFRKSSSSHTMYSNTCVWSCHHFIE